MNLPAGLNNSWLSSAGISESEFRKAESLFAAEKYTVSQEVLNEGITLQGIRETNSVTGEPLWALFAWNLFFQKKLGELEALWSKLGITEITHFPRLHLVDLWAQMHGNKAQRVLFACNEFVDAYRHQISPLIPDFLYLRALANYQLGEPEKSIEDLEVSYALYHLLDNKLGMGRSGNYLGFVLLRMARFDAALNWQSRSLDCFVSLELAKKQSMAMLNTGISHYKIGNFKESISFLEKSHAIGIAEGLIHRQLFTNIALGNVYRITRDHRKARQHLHTAYAQAQELQFPREEALALEFLGDVYRDERLYEDAMRFYGRALAIGQAIAPRGDIVMEVQRRLGECHLALMDVKNAKEALDKSLELARAQQDRYEEAIVLRVMAEVWHHLGQAGKSSSHLEESVAILQEIGARHEWAISLMRSAELRLAEVEQGRPGLPTTVILTQAWDKATRALDLFLQVDVTWWTDECQRLIKRISSLRSQQDTMPREGLKLNAAECPVAYRPVNVIIHKSRRMKEVLQLCDMFAQNAEPVLIAGETGTGKELLARRLHELSDRAEMNLVSVNVAAIPGTLFEREFFGHTRGAFSGAENSSPGFAGQAHGGTLFLDEIGDLPLEVQPKLLRLLQDGTYMSLGDPVERHADIRLVAATNADLAEKVHRGEFRSDLYYRLRTLELELPPLRERPEDVLLLLRHFLSEAEKRPVDLSDYFNRDSLDLLEAYEWPGNVREVAMVARRARFERKAKGRVDLQLVRPSGGKLRVTGGGNGMLAMVQNSQSTSDAVERTRILMALEESGGCRTTAARSLSMSRSTLYRRMQRLGLSG